MQIHQNNFIRNSTFFLGLLVCLFFFGLNITSFSLIYFPGDLGDARFNNYLLEHAHQFFCGNLDSFWNAPFMFPEKNIIAFSDNLLGSAPFYSIFRIFGQDRETSFQYWFLLMICLNYCSCYFLLKYLFKNPIAAILGAIVYSCSLALQNQIGHAQTIPRFAIPIALWMGLLFIEKLNPNYFFAMIFFVVFQIYCGIYLGFMLIIPIAFLVLSSFFVKRNLYLTKIKEFKWWRSILISLLLNSLILMPLIFPYIKRAELSGFYSYHEIVQNIPTIKSYFFSSPGTLFWLKLEHIADEYTSFWDHRLFPGGVASISILIFFVVVIFRVYSKKNSENTIILLFTCFFTFLFFIRINEFSFYKLIFNIPGFGSMRALQRIINIELIFYAIAVAFVFNLFFNNMKRWNQFSLFILVMCIIIFDNFSFANTTHRVEKSISQKRINNLICKMKNISKDGIVSYEPDTMTSYSHEYQLDAMLASQSLSLKCLNGYSATSPEGYSFYWNNPNEESRNVWINLKELPLKKINIIH